MKNSTSHSFKSYTFVSNVSGNIKSNRISSKFQSILGPVVSIIALKSCQEF